jgi:capsular exopolysaccharide synthesis family protein
MSTPEGPGHDSEDGVPPLKSTRDEATGASRRAPDFERRLPDVHLLDYVRVLYKRRWMAATVFVIVQLATAVYTFTTTPIYEARTRLLIESDDPNIVSFKEVIDKGPAESDYYQTQYNILQSRTLARDTLDDLQLWKDPRFGAPPPGALSQLRALAIRLIPFGRDQSQVTPASSSEIGAQSRAVDRFLENLTISPVRNSRLVDVKYRLQDATVAAAVANGVAENYIEQNLSYKFTASRDASTWLGDRLAEQRAQVEKSELALQQYREQNEAISLEDRQNIVVQKLADLNAAVTKAKTERLQKEGMYRQLDAAAKDGATLDTFPTILANSFIQTQKTELATLQRQQAQLAERLGDRHPEMVKVRSAIQNAETELRTEVAKVVQAVRTEYQAALAQEESLSAALNQQKREALAMNRKGIEYSVLEREVESGRQIYQSLMQRAKETSVTGELKSSNVRVVDRAEIPRQPVAPRVLLSLVLGLFGGTFLAFGLVFFFEYLDSRIKTPEEIESRLGIPAIGLIPALGKNWRQVEPLLSKGVPPNFAEAFRALRTNVLFSAAEKGCRVVVVTSAGPGEGKTIVASNLAMGVAYAGQRVLLVDGDLRRPREHEVFGFEQEPGLSNALVGDAKASGTVRRTDVAGLWVLTAGRVPPNAAELLGSRRFKELLASIRGQFDWVVIDSPPVMAVTDPNILANLADSVVFVVGAEMTSYAIARRAVEQLERSRAVFAGGVLNKVQIHRHSYYYSQHYRREYADYYVTAETTMKG